MSRGTVRVWHEEEAWGVIDSDDTPGGCWVHYSSVLVEGYKGLQVGQDVMVDFEAFEQDGYPFRAVEVWPADQDPVRPEPGDVEVGPSAVISLTLFFDNGDEPLRF